MNKNKHKKGFIALYLVMGLSMLFYSWMEIGSRLLFSYIESKKEFEHTRSTVGDVLLCIDAFIQQQRLEEGVFARDLYFKDSFMCSLYNSDRGEGFFLMNNQAVFKVDRVHGFVSVVYVDFL